MLIVAAYLIYLILIGALTFLAGYLIVLVIEEIKKMNKF